MFSLNILSDMHNKLWKNEKAQNLSSFKANIQIQGMNLKYTGPDSLSALKSSEQLNYLQERAKCATVTFHILKELHTGCYPN